jgi:hypothetical protein
LEWRPKWDAFGVGRPLALAGCAEIPATIASATTAGQNFFAAFEVIVCLLWNSSSRPPYAGQMNAR